MAKSILSNKNLQEFINTLRINNEQKNFLLNELSTLNLEERLELLKILENVYQLNAEEDKVKKQIKDNWEN